MQEHIDKLQAAIDYYNLYSRNYRKRGKHWKETGVSLKMPGHDWYIEKIPALCSFTKKELNFIKNLVYLTKRETKQWPSVHTADARNRFQRELQSEGYLPRELPLDCIQDMEDFDIPC